MSMALKELANIFEKNKAEKKFSDDAVLRNWYKERYESTVIQRNLLFIIIVAALAVIAFSMFMIKYVRSTRTIEPFVIEIESKTGVPTVVDPVTLSAYSSNQAIKRYFIWNYITARESYNAAFFDYNYNTVVRVLSSSNVYSNDYRPKFSPSNPNSPKSIYADTGVVTISLKSMIFPTNNTAQVRFTMQIPSFGSYTNVDKISFIEFDFLNVEMNDTERLVNPLGFTVTLYRVEDEKV